MSTVDLSLIQGAILVDSLLLLQTTAVLLPTYFSDLKAMTSVGTSESAIGNNITTQSMPGQLAASGFHALATLKWGIITVTVLVLLLICAV